MISIKSGTQTYSENAHSANLGSDNKNTLSSLEQKENFNGASVGEVLNKIADPNWVDPAKKARVAGGNNLDKNAFMKLLMTQIKNQDPSNPMESHQMAAQLAQFSSLEQMTNMNTNIEAMRKAQAPNTNFDALKMIGMAVKGDSSKISRADIADKHDIGFELANSAQQVTLKIKDTSGIVVRELRASTLLKGKNEVSWDGKLDNGSSARVGEYKVEITAQNAFGKKVHAATSFEGIISGVNFTGSGPVLMVGNKSIKMTDIKNIVDPSKVNAKNNNVTKVKAEAVKSKDGNKMVHTDLDGVAMSREMISKLKKSGVGSKAL